MRDPYADRRTWQTYEQRQKGHGRLERRVLTTSTDLNDYLYREWGIVGQVFRMQRERTIKGHTSCEVVYGLTSLSRKYCDIEKLFGYIRDHWKVENRLHWRRDVLLGEDACYVRAARVAQMLALLNSVVLSLMDLHGITKVARQIRHFLSHPDEAISWVL